MPTLQQLATFVAVSRHGSVARAAQAMGLTASPVSRTLGQLERALVPLFERDYHVLRLTAAGHRLLPPAVAILQAADDLPAIAHGELPPVRFAATPWVPGRFARELAAAVERTGPALDVDTAVSAVLLHRMRHGEIDVALVHLPVDAVDIETLPIARYRFQLAVAVGDPLASRTEVRDADLAGRHVLLLPSSMHPEAMTGLRRFFEQRDVATIDEIDLGDLPSLPARLRREGAVSIVAPDRESPIPRASGMVTVPLAGDPVGMTLGIAWRSRDAARSERLAAVVDALRRRGDITTIGD